MSMWRKKASCIKEWEDNDAVNDSMPWKIPIKQIPKKNLSLHHPWFKERKSVRKHRNLGI